MLDAVWLIPALPLAGFLLLTFAGKRLGEPWAGWIGTAMVGGSFLVTLVVFAGLMAEDEHHRTFVQTLFEWVPAGSLSVDVGFLVDPLSITMALFVTGISALIHLYSIGYMAGDDGYARFFVYLNAFVFSMTMLVLGDNFVLTFLGWEGVGVCSYLLISFWFEKDANAVAGKKAFITNRVGDWGFMLAMFLLFTSVGSLQYTEVFAHLEEFGLAETTAMGIALLLFVGAVGKSAQFPLYLWLPDAMAGPTPVSALIHAATMVTSGVYLMARVNPILGFAPDALDIVAWVGAFTALFAATIAVAQNDIKKVLAYSTISQLGYMFLAIGTGAYVAAVFHMVTHAFFKALLFLGSGSVIHAMAHEQDMGRMGNLRKYLPVTSVTFIVGWLAIAGVPPFAGFWSKDEILIHAWSSSPLLWVVGTVTAVLTAYYMSRQVFLVFFGPERWRESQTVAHDGHGLTPDHEPRESPATMTVPLVALAGLSFVGGLLNLPFKGAFHLERFLEPVFEGRLAHLDVGTSLQWGLPFVVLGLAVCGAAVAWWIFVMGRVGRSTVEPELLEHGWYYDEAIASLVDGPGRAGATLLAEQVDARGVDGAVNGVGELVRRAGTALRVSTSGYVRHYALGIAGGAVLLLGYFISRTGF